jgi:hypothetical protein
MMGLVFLGALLGVFVGRAFAQQADDPLGASISYIATQSMTDANGNRVTKVTLGGTFGDTSFTLDEKQTRAMLGDPNAGLAMRMDTALLGKYYSAHIQQTFGATDEEWKVLMPKLRKVQSLSWQLASHGRSGRGKSGELTNLEKAWGALSQALKRKDAAMEDIKKLLQVVNEEEAKTKAELQQAQKDLRELLSLRQEGLLVQMGLLE